MKITKINSNLIEREDVVKSFIDKRDLVQQKELLEKRLLEINEMLKGFD